MQNIGFDLANEKGISGWPEFRTGTDKNCFSPSAITDVLQQLLPRFDRPAELDGNGMLPRDGSPDDPGEK